MEGPTGRYRIQTVAEMTGVGASTLRAWEQRYGFPAPERTASAYRLYSDADVQKIARVRELCDAGLAPAEAVAAVLAEDAPAPARIDASVVPLPIGSSSPAIDRVVTAAMRSDVAALDEALRAPLVVTSPLVATTTVIEPAWAAVRERWLAGDLDRGQERIAAELFGQVVRDVVRLGQPVPARGHAVLGCFAEDDDVVPLARAAIAIQAQGWRAVLLGARTSAAAIAAAVDRLDARAVVLACGDATPAPRARELLDDYARAAGKRVWVVCGPGTVAIAELARRKGAVVPWLAGDDDGGLALALARAAGRS